jgi:hypothetical protein
MTRIPLRFLRAMAFALTMLGLSSTATAQIGNPFRADVQGYFAGGNDVFQQPTPVALPPWTGPGATLGPYPITGIPSVPAASLTPAYVNPGTPTLPGAFNNFLPGGYIWAPPAITLAGSTLNQAGIKYVGPGGTAVSDAAILTRFDLNNTTSQNSYAQFRFETDFTYSGPLTGGTATSPTLLVSYNTTTYVQFAGQVRYFSTSTDTDGNVLGLWTPLGSVDYDFSALGGSGSAILVSPLSSSALAAPPASDNMLALVGDFFVAGDPASIQVQPVPEPSTWVMGLAGLACARWGAFRRRRAR